MAHEKSITIQRGDGKWVNIPTVVNGRDIGRSEAETLYKNGNLRALQGPFDTVANAVAAAVLRSSIAGENPARLRSKTKRRGLLGEAP